MNLTWGHWIVLGFSILKMGLFSRLCFGIKQTVLRALVLVFSVSLLFEFLGGQGLVIAQWVFLALAATGLLFKRRDADRFELALLGAGLVLWAYLLRNVAFIPSVDDGVHHLYYYQRMHATGHLLTGHVPLIRSALFGRAFLTFYPSGFHAFAAVLEFPLTQVLQLPSWIAMKSEVLLVLASFLPLLYRLGRTLFPSIPRTAVIVAAIFSGILDVFPSNAIAEGGISRVAGLVFMVWAVQDFLGSQLRRGTLFYFLGLVLPLAFWIHPSAVAHLCGAIILIGLSGPDKSLLPILVELGAGLLVFAAWVWGLVHSGPSLLIGAGGVISSLPVLSLNWRAVIDRLKGPVHYLLRDSIVPGHFMSPRTLLFLAGAYWMVKEGKKEGAKEKLKRNLFALFLFLPFFIALLQFSAFTPFVALGMFYYHSVKRVAEFFVLPLFMGWCAALAYLWPFRATRVALGVVSGLALVLGVPALDARLGLTNQSFATVSNIQLEHARAVMEPYSRSEKGTWFCEGQRYQPLMGVSKNTGLDYYFTRGTECSSGRLHESYCAEEAKVFKARLNEGLLQKTAVWVSFGSESDGCYWLK